MRILVIEPPSRSRQGDQVHRVDAPLTALAHAHPVDARAGCWLSLATQAEAEICEVLVLCQSVDIDFLALLARRRARGLITVFELNDDFLGATPAHAVFSFWQAPRTQSTAFALMRQADGLQFSSLGLKKKFGFLNPHHRVFHNAMPNSALTLDALLAAKDTKIRVGWGGSLAHRDDVMMMMPALRKLMQDHPHWTLCVMAPPEAHRWFQSLPTARCLLYRSGTFEAYLKFCMTLHIGLAPLCDSIFNRSRSDGKCIEYAASGAAIVAAAHPTFQDICIPEKTALPFSDAQTLYDAVKRLLTSAALRTHLVLNAHAHVRAERRVEALADARFAFYRELLLRRPDSVALTPSAAGPVKGDYHLIAKDRAASFLLMGLESKDDSEAINCFTEAALLSPAHPLPLLYRACRRPPGVERSRDLMRAHTLRPEAPHASLLLLEDAIGRGDVPGATAARALRADASDNAWRFELEGRLSALTGDVASASTAYDRALAPDCDHRPALLRAIELRIACSEMRQAEALWERGRKSLLATVEERAWVAQQFLRAGRPRAAQRCCLASLGRAD